jgi:hypothetical protein
MVKPLIVWGKVTRLGEFSPVGPLFTLGSILNCRSRLHFLPELLFNFDKKMGWASGHPGLG